MSLTLGPYPEYKDSGLPWLGKIPTHWRVVRNARLFSERNQTGYPDLPILEVSLQTGVTLRSFAVGSRKQVMGSREQYKRAVKGDIAYNMMRMWQGAVGVVPVEGLVSPAYVVARPLPGSDSRYFAYLFRTAAYMNEVNKYSHGIVTDRNRLYWDEFKQMPSVLPLEAEQSAMANYLDSSARYVQAAMRAKRRVIELLNEQKQAIIHQAITHGLDSNVCPTPSAISPLGNVPSDWRASRLKYLVRNVNDQTDARRNGEGYIRLEDVESWTGRLRPAEGDVQFESQVRRFRAGDILFGKLRPYLAKVTRPSFDGVCVSEFLVLRPRTEKIRPDFLEQKLRSNRIIDAVNSSTFGAKMPRAEWTFIGNLSISFPSSVTEQEQILKKIQKATFEVEAAIDRASIEVQLVREYHTRLIADVVTGKLDVREIELPAIEQELADEMLLQESKENSEAGEDASGQEVVEETVDADD